MGDDFLVTEFVHSVLDPAVDLWCRTQDGLLREQSFASVALIEAYGWLSLGVQAGNYDRAMSGHEVRSRRKPLQAAIEFAEASNLIDRGVTRQFGQLLGFSDPFPPPFHERFPSEFAELPEASTSVAVWTLEYRNLATSSSAQVFVETLNFAYEQEWREAVDSPMIERFNAEAHSASPPSLFEGYFRCLQHLDRMAELLGTQGVASQKVAARARLRDEAARIHRWRLDFRHALFAPRFRQITEMVAQRLIREAKANIVAFWPRTFTAAVFDLVTRYRVAVGEITGSTTPIMASATV